MLRQWFDQAIKIVVPLLIAVAGYGFAIVLIDLVIDIYQDRTGKRIRKKGSL